MADGISSSTTQIQSNYEKYKEYFSTEEKNNLGQTDFLKLMTEQMKNQDFMNPTDNAEYIAQLAQFNTLQQMQQMVYYSNSAFASSLVGKTVTMAEMNKQGEMVSVTDVVTAVKFASGNFEIVVGGKSFSTANLMEVLSEKPKTIQLSTDNEK